MALEKNLKRCAASNGSKYVPRKKRKVASNFDEESINILDPQREPERYASSDNQDLLIEGRVPTKCNILIPAGYARTQNISSYDVNAAHPTRVSHLSSCEKKSPAALNEILIALKIHEIISNLAKFKNNTSDINQCNNSNFVASSQSLTSQSDSELYEWNFLKAYGQQNGMNEDRAEDKLFEVIQDLIKLQKRSGVTALEADGVKHILHHIVDEYLNTNDGTVDDNMDDKPGCSWWAHPK